MPGLVPGIHALKPSWIKDVDGRDKPAMTITRVIAHDRWYYIDVEAAS